MTDSQDSAQDAQDQVIPSPADGNPVAAQGTRTAADVVTPELIRDVYGLDCEVYADPVSGTPVVTPR